MQKLETFASAVAEICSHSLVVPERPLRWTIIANPKAGGFTINSRWKKHRVALEDALDRAKKNPRRGDAGPSGPPDENNGFGLVPTTGPGHAGKIVSALLDAGNTEDAGKAANVGNVGNAGKADPFYLVITAGGDGTSLEVLQALFSAPPEQRSRFAVLRLPMGTGNDGADSPDLSKALDLLVNPSRPEKTGGVRLSTASGKTWPDGNPFLAFNILSIGLDAFVTHMTNKMKGKFPGDSYKLWVDIASLLYDRIYRVGALSVKGYDARGGEVMNLRERLLLCAMGASGRRSYGAQKKILPDDRNVCMVKQMSLFRKLAIKGRFTSGNHILMPESIMGNAAKLVIDGENPILAQMDGEAVLLEKEDFPLVIELTEKTIQKLTGV
ncbi:MAG: diacylglycerol kinase [Treponema sp.]|jgi:diacylglycerol kinase family enzyme|nr:diacylglycerol kinase [Treponema sp.]